MAGETSAKTTMHNVVKGLCVCVEEMEKAMVHAEKSLHEGTHGSRVAEGLSAARRSAKMMVESHMEHAGRRRDLDLLEEIARVKLAPDVDVLQEYVAAVARVLLEVEKREPWI